MRLLGFILFLKLFLAFAYSASTIILGPARALTLASLTAVLRARSE